MGKGPKENITKSSNLFRLLLFCVLIYPSAVYATSGDTLIVDGKKVLINRVIEYDTVKVDHAREPSEIKRPKNAVPWLLGAEGGAYATASVLQSDLNDLQTVDQFTNQSVRFSVDPAAVLFGGLILSDQWSVMVGAGVRKVTARVSNFDTQQLDDSLYQFESFDDGDLSQITRYDFGELGAEFDTIPVDLTESRLSITYFEIPLLFNYSLELPKSRDWKLDFQFGLQAQFVFNQSPAGILLLNSNAELENVPESGQRFTRVLFGAQAAAGISRRLMPNLFGYARIHLQMPLNSPTDPVSRVQFDFYQGGLQLGIRYHFKP